MCVLSSLLHTRVTLLHTCHTASHTCQTAAHTELTAAELEPHQRAAEVVTTSGLCLTGAQGHTASPLQQEQWCWRGDSGCHWKDGGCGGSPFASLLPSPSLCPQLKPNVHNDLWTGWLKTQHGQRLLQCWLCSLREGISTKLPFKKEKAVKPWKANSPCTPSMHPQPVQDLADCAPSISLSPLSRTNCRRRGRVGEGAHTMSSPVPRVSRS